MQKNKPGQTLFVVTAGKAAQTGGNGNSVLHPGDCFGELCVFGVEDKYDCSVLPLGGNLEVLLCSQQDFQEVFDEEEIGIMRDAAVQHKELVAQKTANMTADEAQSATMQEEQEKDRMVVEPHLKVGFKPTGSTTVGGGSSTIPTGFVDEVQRLLFSVLDEIKLTRDECERNTRLLNMHRRKVEELDVKIESGLSSIGAKFSGQHVRKMIVLKLAGKWLDQRDNDGLSDPYLRLCRPKDCVFKKVTHHDTAPPPPQHRTSSSHATHLPVARRRGVRRGP